jgi:outer membrane biogenesis lipoprotein LolB
MRRVVLGIVVIGLLAGCSTWGRGISRPPQRSQEEQVEARREKDAKTKKCVLEQQVRRQQEEQGRSVKPFPKEKC